MSEPASPHVEVAAYLLGKLEAEESETFETHLAGCADCRRQLEELRGLPVLLAKATPAVPVPDGLRARTLAAVHQAAEDAPAAAPVAAAPAGDGAAPGPSRREWWRRRWLAVAVVAAALVAALAIPGVRLLQDDGQVTRLSLVAPPGTGS